MRTQTTDSEPDRRPRPVTGKDVARRAGVSLATVSLALSGRFQEGHAVAEATRERIINVAAELGYVPNHIGRSLRQRKTTILALLVPDLTNPYYTEIFEGGHRVALQRGYELTVVSAANPRSREHTIRLLRGGSVDGVIVAHHAAELLQELRRPPGQWVPTVTVQGASPDPEIPGIRVDTREGAFVATRHLVALGHRRIAHLTVIPPSDYAADDPMAPPSSHRLLGYRRALEEAGIEYRPGLVVTGDIEGHLLEVGAAAVRDLLQRPAPRPTAAFIYNDMLAIGAIRELLDRGVRVPEDIAIVGHDGIDLGAFTNPRLTSVAHRCREQGNLAVETLCDLLEGRFPAEVDRVLPPELVVRESSGAGPTALHG